MIAPLSPKTRLKHPPARSAWGSTSSHQALAVTRKDRFRARSDWARVDDGEAVERDRFDAGGCAGPARHGRGEDGAGRGKVHDIATGLGHDGVPAKWSAQTKVSSLRSERGSPMPFAHGTG